MTKTASKVFRVLDSGTNQVHELDSVSRACSCGTVGCEHYKLLADLLSKDRTVAFQVTSALHKELRRGDLIRASVWADWSDHVRGASRTKKYVRDVFLEECRGIETYNAWQNGGTRSLSSRQMVETFCRTKKKWELPELSHSADIVFAAMNEALDMPLITPEEIKAPSSGRFEFFEWMRLFYRVDLVKRTSDRDRFGNIVKDRGFNACAERLAEAFSAALENAGLDAVLKLYRDRPTHLDNCWVAAEHLTGMIDQEADTLRTLVESEARWSASEDRSALEGLQLITPPDYCLDWHTAAGKPKVKRMLDAKFGPGYEPGAPLPHGLDLRWSGQIVGVWWRYHAFEQLGENYLNASWESVRFNESQWGRAVRVGKVFRGTLQPPCLTGKVGRTVV